MVYEEGVAGGHGVYVVRCLSERVCVTERERAKGWLAAFVISNVAWRVKGRRW